MAEKYLVIPNQSIEKKASPTTQRPHYDQILEKSGDATCQNRDATETLGTLWGRFGDALGTLLDAVASQYELATKFLGRDAGDAIFFKLGTEAKMKNLKRGLFFLPILPTLIREVYINNYE